MSGHRQSLPGAIGGGLGKLSKSRGASVRLHAKLHHPLYGRTKAKVGGKISEFALF
jgi:hypothetical protein